MFGWYPQHFYWIGNLPPCSHFPAKSCFFSKSSWWRGKQHENLSKLLRISVVLDLNRALCWDEALVPGYGASARGTRGLTLPPRNNKMA
eukprot:1334383-Rhodomonas_salina.2